MPAAAGTCACVAIPGDLDPVGTANRRLSHKLEAWFRRSRRQRLVLGQVKVSEKSNEIAAIPALLGMLAIEGAIVTIDAMGCQREIAAKILAKKADYFSQSKATKALFARTSSFSRQSRKPTASRIQSQPT